MMEALGKGAMRADELLFAPRAGLLIASDFVPREYVKREVKEKAHRERAALPAPVPAYVRRFPTPACTGRPTVAIAMRVSVSGPHGKLAAVAHAINAHPPPEVMHLMPPGAQTLKAFWPLNGIVVRGAQSLRLRLDSPAKRVCTLLCDPVPEIVDDVTDISFGRSNAYAKIFTRGGGVMDGILLFIPAERSVCA